MSLLLVALALLLGSGGAALCTGRSGRWSTALGAGGAVVACVAGLIPALRVLFGAPTSALRVAWEVPGGAFFVEIDPLSAFFLVLIFGLSALAAVYGSEYMRPHGVERSLGPSWFFFNALVASMALVVTARNGLLFLVAWEGMALASFFLVTFEDEHESVRAAGRTYLVATHLGTAFLLVLFLLLGRSAGSLDFDHFSVLPAQAGPLFLLAVVGFGAKAGFLPLHVWLPEAHPAAPSHVSALMSGVMIKTGIYGLLRISMLLGPPAPWWGWLLLSIGLLSGIFGVLFALAQRDIKRVLAYSSVENVGLIGAGLGLGLLGLSNHAPFLAVLGFAGALLHVLNHALFKGLLFFGAGVVAHETGTRDLEKLGGLLKRMPVTAAAMLVGVVAICGLPPLNGFAGEFLLYLAALRGITSVSGLGLAGALSVAALALIGGLAAACFARVFGVAFLGEPRSAATAHAHEPGLAMQLPGLLLAGGCVLIGALAPLVVASLAPVIEPLTGLSHEVVRAQLTLASRPLWMTVLAAALLLGLVAVLAALRRRLLAGRPAAAGVTWDCGYAQPTPRMQYTASSFAQPLTDLFALYLRPRRQLEPAAGLFPRQASLHTQTGDLCGERVYEPIFGGIGRTLAALRWLQHGQVNLYVFYIAATLLALLMWQILI
jgi:hydrogenase-4 component B